jgi:hypothetical protein
MDVSFTGLLTKIEKVPDFLLLPSSFIPLSLLD